jgi:hypothetical protein
MLSPTRHRSRVGLLALSTAALAIWGNPSPAHAVVYTNVTLSAGINHLHNPTKLAGAFFQNGGAAAADFDNDGWVDLYVSRWNLRDLLYRNRGDGTFEDVAQTAGISIVGSSNTSNGSAWGDIDNDGDKDLFVTSSGGNRFALYVNDGAGRFTEQAVQRGAAIAGAIRYGQSATFGDFDNDGYIDIHTNDWGSDTSVSSSRLLRNLGAANPGFFEDVTAAAGLNVYRAPEFENGPTNSNAYRFSSTFADLDRDGRLDLAIAADFRTSQVFWNNGDGTFTDGTLAAGVGAVGDGMGATIGDFDGDGLLDWFVSARGTEPPSISPVGGNYLYRNNGDRTFTDVATSTGVRDTGWAWGTTFLDHDNDGDQDLFVTNGWGITDRTRIFENNGAGVFSDVSTPSGVTDNGLGRALISLDYDNDGDLDVFLVNHGARPILYRNDGGAANDWLKVDVEGTVSNRDGLGAFITVDPDTPAAGDEMVREVNVGSNFLGHNEVTSHFGLGAGSITVDKVNVFWPASGLRQTYVDVPINSTLAARERLLGDLNRDGAVDAADYVVWRDGLGQSGVGVDADGAGPNGLPDGTVDSLDFAYWNANYGQTWGSIAGTLVETAIPEPPCSMLLIVGGAPLLTRWRASRGRR